MTHQQNFIDELYKLAAQVAENAQHKDTEFDQKVKALQALTPYYAALMKGKKDRDDDSDSPGGNFGTWRENLSAVEGGDDDGETGGPVQAGASRRG
jgi:hypothetical protein